VLAVLLAALAASSGCGQRGPLSLPDSAQPVQRVDPNAVPPTSAPAPAAEPDGADEEQAENGR
jgi:predicted small lipoprotein YifL